MQFSKNKSYQYLFFVILTIYTIFNGGNSNISIQINFILVSFLFLFCLKDKNYNLHLVNFYKDNQKSILIYFIFLSYLIFQIIPLPLELLKLFSPEKYKLINNLNVDILTSSISLSPSNSFFQILNYITLLILVFTIKMIFYTDRHKNRFNLFLSFLGFITSIIAITFYLNGNPDFLIFKNSFYKNASTGFFINRTVSAVFLLFCLIASLEFLKSLDEKKIKRNRDDFFLKIYVRLFIIFITIGIITSFSRIGNFLLLITIIFYLINELFVLKSNNKSFRNTILLIIFFDIVILGIYFGSSQLFDRFYLLKDDLILTNSSELNLNRFKIIEFSLSELRNFKFFGYGSGSFENLFVINFDNPSHFYANHSHSDIIEFIGEFGLVGFIFLIISLLKFFFNKERYTFINLILMSYLLIILGFDFALHVPLIQISFIIFFNINKNYSV